MRCEDRYCIYIYMAQDRELWQELVNPGKKTGWQILTRKAVDILPRTLFYKN